MRPLATSSAEAARARLDELLVERGLARTRAEAGRLILAGRVRVAGGRGDKAGRLVRRSAEIELVRASPFVSRGGEKLAPALDAFGVAPEGRVCLDVGASTGGFTDCLLKRGARRVYAVDVGRGQLDARLGADTRVAVLDGVNARYLGASQLGEPVALATVDVSFISAEKILPALLTCLAPSGEVVLLVKPQFEVGRGQVGKGGVVRDARLHAAVVLRVARTAAELGLRPCAVCASPLRGPKGNREFFLHLRRGAGDASATLPDGLEAAVAAVAGSEVR